MTPPLPLTTKTGIGSFFKSFFLVFVSVYFILYIFPYPFTEDVGVHGYAYFLDPFVLWVGRTILGLTDLQSTQIGSSDTTFIYVGIFVRMLLALAVALVLALWKGKAFHSDRLFRWAYTYVRFTTGIFIITYGVGKMGNGGQFLYPTVAWMDAPLGNLSPMSLLWTFMGYSRSFSVFTGVFEILGGMLLLFRRTMVLGALVSFGVMLNVVALNYSYNVCVKTFSTHLLLFLAFLLMPNIATLWRLFLNNNSWKTIQPELPRKWMRISAIALLSVIALVKVNESWQQMRKGVKHYRSFESLNAIYRTKNFIVNGDTLQPPPVDSVRWEKMIIDNNYAVIVHMDKSIKYYSISVDTTARALTLSEPSDSTRNFELRYNYNSENEIFLQGVLESDSIAATFRLIRGDDFLLGREKFKWIIE
ncbi:MAG: hypothetical protein JNM22_07010 [Saprospiraceae bacterium]|nr:hypothetical protein [Saprospiraceae bacterium]